jgi:hypothetical protein
MSEVAHLIEQSRSRDAERERQALEAEAERAHADLQRMSESARHFMEDSQFEDESRDFGDDDSEVDFQEGYQPQTPTADLDGLLGKQYERRIAATGSLSPVEFDIDNLKLRLAEAQQFSTTAESEVDRLRTKLADYQGDAHKSEELLRELDTLRQQLDDAERNHHDAQKAVEAKQVPS